MPTVAKHNDCSFRGLAYHWKSGIFSLEAAVYNAHHGAADHSKLVLNQLRRALGLKLTY